MIKSTTEIPRLMPAIVVHVDEDECHVRSGHGLLAARYATRFPTPRVERVSPGHLVAIADVPGHIAVVVWRWYDAVVISEHGEHVRLWEPAHGEVLADRRPGYISSLPGTRCYLSAGLPGAEWWVAGPAVATASDADVELDEVDRLYTEHNLWGEV